jgi:glutathione S-transferase
MRSREIGVTQLAAARGISRWTARRWLQALEAQWGPRVVTRRGRRMVTTDAALARVAPWAGADAATDRRLRALERRVADAEIRIRASRPFA